MSTIEFHAVEKRYGEVRALKPLTLTIPDRALCALLGPSGCGKSTTLRLLAGLETPDAGTILLDGRDITKLPPEKRPCALVFQSYALWPHMTVFENLAYGLRFQKVSRAELGRRVRLNLDRVGLTSLEKRYPRQLSGGEQQRIALARAIALEPQVLLLDEPLSNLDAGLRDDLRTQIRALHDELGMTTVFVTHDQGEALSLADQVVVMRGGIVQQSGTPRDLFHRPAKEFVASFLGKTNVLEGRLGPDIRLDSGEPPLPGVNVLRTPDFLRGAPPQPVQLCIRSDRPVILHRERDADLVTQANALVAQFQHRFFFGTFQRTVWKAAGTVLYVDIAAEDDRDFGQGEWALHLPDEGLLVYTQEGELLRG